MPLRAISLFSGAGGLDLAAKWAGIRTIAYVEKDPYAQGVLMSRMRDGSLDDAPIFEDVRTFRGTSLRGSIEVVFGGFPCQDVSVAGKRVGLQGSRSGLWFEFVRIIREVGPHYVLVENVPGLVYSGGIGDVLGSLAELGYDAEWTTLSAAEVGAPHIRSRVWIVAYAKSITGSETNTATDKDRGLLRTWVGHQCRSWHEMASPDWTIPASWVLRDINGLAFRSDRTRLTGNGVVSQQSFPFFHEIVGMSENDLPIL